MSDSWLIGASQLLLVALLWGVTNPALNRASKEQEKNQLLTTTQPQTKHNSVRPSATATGDHPTTASDQKSSTTPITTSTPPSIPSLLINYKFLLPFLLNQSGSILYLHCLSLLPVSFAVPTVNALTMVITALTAYAMGEKQQMNLRIFIGMCFILTGITLCVLSQHWQQTTSSA